MRRQPSLRSQLNQIRLWVRQGRTDAWIAHKLDIGVDDLARFKREHQLEADETAALKPADPLSVPPPEPAAAVEDLDEEEEEEEEEQEEERPRSRERAPSRRRAGRPPRRRAPRADRDEDEDEDEEDRERERAPRGVPGEDEDGEPRRRRRRGRRGGRRHRARRNAFEATFDHGEEGYGLWLDPAVVDNPVYSEHWAGHRAVTVTLEADTITIRRAQPGGADQNGERPGDDGDDE